MIGSVDLLYSLSGFGVGVLVGMTGVGGAVPLRERPSY
jgi:hypothetical protein